MAIVQRTSFPNRAVMGMFTAIFASAISPAHAYVKGKGPRVHTEIGVDTYIEKKWESSPGFWEVYARFIGQPGFAREANETMYLRADCTKAEATIAPNDDPSMGVLMTLYPDNRKGTHLKAPKAMLEEDLMRSRSNVLLANLWYATCKNVYMRYFEPET
ncbi:hypothetical protein [Terrihabitans rhizophilus]|uniref:Uncharacterized protein n=1 Tax=Terrihabitans rhizophilus TaxID=3092662 RepID=A0ABU4RUS6_9HYPH|nr:hypothetical protein [Terrihabitans sp. PJ23]MDX6806611.1 hypothetical protein [Terrihabitans sp. PJ23]